MKVRSATFEDLPQILAIYNDAVLKTTASYDYEPRSMEHRVAWFEDHRKQDYPVLVAVNDQAQVVGWGSLSKFHDRMGYRFTTENSIYVAAEHRGKGIGKLLLAALIQAARDRNMRAIIGIIDAQNEASLRLHEGFGFEKVALLKQVGYKFDRWLDVVFVELLLAR